MKRYLIQRVLMGLSCALVISSCDQVNSETKRYKLDWVAAEIQQDNDYDFDAQSLDVLTLRLISHDKDLQGILVQESYHQGPFYLLNGSSSVNYCNFSIPNVQTCVYFDTTFIYISSSTEHPKKVSDEDVASLLSGRLYYWPDPKFLKPGVLCDSIEIKKVPNFHSATCPSGKPYYRTLFRNKEN